MPLHDDEMNMRREKRKPSAESSRPRLSGFVSR